jgi:hypothetical protein
MVAAISAVTPGPREIAHLAERYDLGSRGEGNFVVWRRGPREIARLAERRDLGSRGKRNFVGWS